MATTKASTFVDTFESEHNCARARSGRWASVTTTVVTFPVKRP
jgi:hypothetical protein